MKQTIELIKDCISIQEDMEYVVHFIYMGDMINENDLWFNHWFGDGKGNWMCINITDGEILI